MEKESMTSKWGPDDEIGALNDITPEKVLEATRLIRTGKIFRLAHVFEYGMPHEEFHGDFTYFTFHRHQDILRLLQTTNKLGAMNTRLEMSDHTGTHLDGINHTSLDGRLYNGISAEDITGPFGTTRLGIEKTPPIFTRGLLADVASLNRAATLKQGYVISPEEIASSLGNLTIRKGDALLIRTGWSQLWMSDNTKYIGSCPGIGLSAARWLGEKRVALVGVDTSNGEVAPNEDPNAIDAVHQILIAKNGIRLVENLTLEELKEEKIKEFAFICLPLPIKGGAGSPVSPIAVL